MRTFAICLTVLAAALPTAAQDWPNKQPDRLHILLVTGVDYPGHLW